MSKKVIIIPSFLLIAIIIVLANVPFRQSGISQNKSVRTNDLELLRSLPYVSWSNEEVDTNLSGVVRNDHAKTFNGYNLYTDHERYAFLMDMNGQVMHRWQFPSTEGKWEYVELLPDGVIVAVCVYNVLAKLNKDSEIIWIKDIKPHHDIEVLPDGTYLVPISTGHVVYNSRKVSFDSIAHVSTDGKILDTWSTYEHLTKLQELHPPTILDIPGDTTKENSGEQYDYYHLNTIEALPDTPLGHKDKRFQEGNYMACLRNVSLIIVIDKDSKNIMWSWGPGKLDWPHMPTMLANGNILIFDNGVHRRYSRVIEIEPVTGNIVWEYKATPPESFHSKWRGSNQRFPNGNTLICESEKGRVFEVTSDKHIVWDFFNPEMKGRKRHSIYRMIRVPEEKTAGWLDLHAIEYKNQKHR